MGFQGMPNEAMSVIEAYRTLLHRGQYPADQVLKGLDGSFGFVAPGANEGVKLFWGIAADGSVVSDKLRGYKVKLRQVFCTFPLGKAISVQQYCTSPDRTPYSHHHHPSATASSVSMIEHKSCFKAGITDYSSDHI